MLEELRSFGRNARLFLLFNSVNSIGLGIFYLVFNIYVVEGLSYSEYFLGILLSASSFAAALFSLPAGIMGDRFGRKKCLIIGTAGSVASMGLLITVQSQWILVVANALLGFTVTVTYVSFAPFMMENTSSRERVHLFSVNGAVVTLGFTAGEFIGGRLPSLFYLSQPEALRATLFVSVVLSFVSVIPLFFLTEKKKEILFSRRIIESTSLMEKFLLIQVLTGFGAGLVIPFFNIFFRIKLQASVQMIGNIFAVGSIVTGVATFFAASLASRCGKVRSVVFTQASSLPFLILIAFSPYLSLVTLSYIIRGALMNMVSPIISAFMMETLREEERATVNGIVSAGWNGSWAISNIVAGNLMSRNLYEVPFLITSTLYALATVLFYRFFRSLDRNQ
ncbi:MAG: MFS transporter [Theionarchaea archaeon]|nr:MFS transporter [Theionarchaea archaeon]